MAFPRTSSFFVALWHTGYVVRGRAKRKAAREAARVRSPRSHGRVVSNLERNRFSLTNQGSVSMLVLTRKYQEKIRIGNNITITVLRTKGKAVRLGIEAPSDVPVIRGELSFENESSEVEE